MLTMREHKGRQVAARHWELVEDGILVECHCEKGWACPANDMIYRPLEAPEIEKQVLSQINRFRQEYQVSASKVSYYRESGSGPVSMYRFVLFGMWKDPGSLERARQNFDRAE